MKPTRPSEVRALLDRLALRPRKKLGQNFLVDANILAIMLETAAITPADEILEIGAGLGVLTQPLTEKARRVVAVEKDPKLYNFLKGELAARPNLELIRGDILRLDHEKLLASGITKVVANLPYSVGSAILVNLLQAQRPPAAMIVTLQAEVARRLTALPGSRDFGLLGLWSQTLYHSSIRKTISPSCFYPMPGVHSAILLLSRREPPLLLPAQKHFFFMLTKFIFSRRRKQLGTLLRNLPANWRPAPERIRALLAELEIDPQARPETLSVCQWLRLAEALQAMTQLEAQAGCC